MNNFILKVKYTNGQDCSSSPPCQNNATCANLTNYAPNGVGFICNCASGFVGFYCEKSK